MNPVRSLFLAIATLLLLSACSQPADIYTPTLEPQFGETNSGTDYAEHMAASTDGVYLGGRWDNRPALIRFTRSGRIPGVTTLPSSAVVRAVTAGPGVVYVVYSRDDADGTRSFSARKYSQTGTVLWTRELASGLEQHNYNVNAAAATDGKGNLYLSAYLEDGARAELRKYWAKGTLAWRKQDTGSVADIDVSSSGLLHTVSDVWDDHQTLTRYRSNGELLWRVVLPEVNDSRKVAVGSGNEIYVATNDEEFQFELRVRLTKYDSHGTRIWTREVQDAFDLRLDGLDADDQGNAFLGLTNPDYDQDQSRRFKEFYTYSPSGKRLVYREFDFGTERPLVGPVALAPTEVYLATSGVGDESRDGLLLRLDGLTGSVTWER